MLKKILSGIILFIIICFLGLFTYLIIIGNSEKNKIKNENSIKEIPNKFQSDSKNNTLVPKDENWNENSKTLINSKTDESKEETSIKNDVKIQNPPKIFKTQKTQLNKDNTLLSRKLLEQALKKLDIKNWRTTVKLSYAKNTQIKTSNESNKYKINHFAFEPNMFQKLVIQEIAQKINFANLIIIFEYYQNFQEVKIKIAFEDKPIDFVEKYYQLTTD